ncbi:hypothetical protein LIER_38403 [Lithospermum erythrorhizon]|uniref:Uncharacterized protein n=1 Tax=Lithospermum erythrorhizon TaxID=34254 RepID=A0AAV3Q2G1_LITER
MKNKNLKNKNFPPQKSNTQNGKSGKKRVSITHDPFFVPQDDNSKRRRKVKYDEDIESGSEDSGSEDNVNEVEVDEEEEETAAEMRKRVAEAYIEKLRRIEEKNVEGEGGSDEDEGWDRKREKEGERDSRVAKMLHIEQMEDSGRLRKSIASRVQKPELTDGFQCLVKHRQSVTSLALSDDDSRGFSASKDGTIVHWDVDSGKTEKYAWPSDELLKSHGVKDPQGRASKHSRHVLALTVSYDNRYLATGGLDRHIHLWDIRTREHLQAFPGHRGPVSCLAFRQGTTELFSGSFDRAIKIWNAEDRAYVSTLYGHQNEVLTIDCLRKERALTVGRDRTMHLWKVPEESQLIFRAPAASLECGCFIGNDEFLSGSDDGSIEHWNILRKKPVHIVKNAHSLTGVTTLGDKNDNGLTNGILENGTHGPSSHYSSVHSWVSSVAVCPSSDLAASGAGNGSIRLWAIENESKGIHPLFELPLVGFVNSLAFAKSGKFLIAGVGQEPRLGRWGKIPKARNGVSIHTL